MTVSRLLDVVHASALSMWAGIIVMVGVVAAKSFPTARDLDPAVPSLSAYEGDHWRIVGGRLMDGGFSAADALGGVLFGMALLTLMLAHLFERGPTGRLRHVRHGVLICVGAVSAYSLLSFRPEMQGHLTAYWTAAEGGDNGTAEARRAAFGAMHGRASALLGVTLVLLVLGAAMAAFAPFGEPTRDAPGSGDT